MPAKTTNLGLNLAFPRSPDYHGDWPVSLDENLQIIDAFAGTVGGGGGTPGGSSGELQGNNSGAFGSAPGSLIDFTNGTLTIAPSGTSADVSALTVIGDSIQNNILSLWVYGSGESEGIQVGAQGYMFMVPAAGGGNPALTIIGDSDGNFALALHTNSSPGSYGTFFEDNGEGGLNMVCEDSTGGLSTYGPSELTISNTGSGGVLSASPAGIGFWGGGPITQPTITGSKGGNVALGNILTELANYGLIIDSTT